MESVSVSVLFHFTVFSRLTPFSSMTAIKAMAIISYGVPFHCVYYFFFAHWTVDRHTDYFCILLNISIVTNMELSFKHANFLYFVFMGNGWIIFLFFSTFLFNCWHGVSRWTCTSLIWLDWLAQGFSCLHFPGLGL